MAEDQTNQEAAEPAKSDGPAPEPVQSEPAAAEPVKAEPRPALARIEPQAGSDMPLLRIEGVAKKFGNFRAVDHVSLDIRAGEFFALLGPSGCGKTTLLRMLAGFETPDEGRIVLNGKD